MGYYDDPVDDHYAKIDREKAIETFTVDQQIWRDQSRSVPTPSGSDDSGARHDPSPDRAKVDAVLVEFWGHAIRDVLRPPGLDPTDREQILSDLLDAPPYQATAAQVDGILARLRNTSLGRRADVMCAYVAIYRDELRRQGR